MVATAKRNKVTTQIEVTQLVETKVKEDYEVNVLTPVPGVLLARAAVFAEELASGLYKDPPEVDAVMIRDGLMSLHMQLSQWASTDEPVLVEDYSFLTKTMGEKA